LVLFGVPGRSGDVSPTGLSLPAGKKFDMKLDMMATRVRQADASTGTDRRRIPDGMVVVKGSNAFGEGSEFCAAEVDADC
jgi:hypothetical protein